MPNACYLHVLDHIMVALIFFVWPARKLTSAFGPQGPRRHRALPHRGAPLSILHCRWVAFKVVGAFHLLACTLVRRFGCSRQPSDLKTGIEYFHLRIHLPLRDTGTPISEVSAELTNALSFKTKLDPNSEHDNTKEVISIVTPGTPQKNTPQGSFQDWLWP